MATGGDEFGYENLDLDNQLDHDEEREVNTTQPFKPPQAASSPLHFGESVEMQTRQHEQTGLPKTSYEETPLLGSFIHQDDKPAMLERAKELIRRKFPEVDFGKLGPIGFSKKGNDTDIVSFGPLGGESKIFKSGGSDFLKTFTDKKSKALGRRAEDIIAEDRDTIREEKQRLKESENQLKQSEVLAAKREKEVQAMQELRQKTERTQAQIDAIQDEQGSNVESEAELRRLRQLKKNLQTDFEKAKKKWPRLKNKQKTKKKNKQRSKDLEQSSRQKKVTETF